MNFGVRVANKNCRKTEENQIKEKQNYSQHSYLFPDILKKSYFVLKTQSLIFQVVFYPRTQDLQIEEVWESCNLTARSLLELVRKPKAKAQTHHVAGLSLLHRDTVPKSAKDSSTESDSIKHLQKREINHKDFSCLFSS